MRFVLFTTFLIIIGFFSGCAVRAYKVPTAAMSPTINPGDGCIADEASYRLGAEVKRFDIVSFKSPPVPWSNGERHKFIFRVIGLGGEKVEIKKGKVFINDKLLEEPFEKNPSEDDFAHVVVPENEFFLLGDNRPDSWDSRFWKPATIKREDIYGKVVQILPGYYKE